MFRMRIIDAETGESVPGDVAETMFESLTESVPGDVVFIKQSTKMLAVLAVIECDRRNITFTFSESKWNGPFQKTAHLDGTTFNRLTTSSPHPEPIKYVITTSGTTGTPKVVAVPTTAIMDNVEDFVHRLKISKDDVILLSTSFLFDPSMVEVLTGVSTGATIVVAPDEYRSKPILLAECIIKYRPTVIQMTPTVFSTLGVDCLSTILSSESFLQTLLIGGGPFPLSLIRSYRQPGNKTRIYDVYGVTEVSCWATIREIEKDTMDVLLGDPLKNTRVLVSGEETILIEGSRVCYINGVKPRVHDTGDLVSTRGSGWVIEGRKDHQIKVNGIRTNLSYLSRLVKSINGVTDAHFIYKQGFLTLFVVSRTSLEDKLRTLLPVQPAMSVYVDALPVNSNGKVAEVQCLKLLDARLTEKSLEKTLQKYGIDRNNPETMTMTFSQFGVDSLAAAELAMFAEDRTEALRRILSSDTTVGEFLATLSLDTTHHQGHSHHIHPRQRRQPRLKWSVKLKKCIDGSPVVHRLNDEPHIVAACHSGEVVNVELDTGRIKWKVDLPTRIEATPLVVDDLVVVGGYDGIVYSLNTLTGQILWRVQTGDQVKAEVEKSPDNCDAYIVSYDSYVYKLSTRSGDVMWKCHVENGKGSPAKPVYARGLLFVTFITGAVIAIGNNGSIQWRHDCGEAIFSRISLFQDSCLACTVTGNVLLLDINSGRKIRKISLEEPIFAGIHIDCETGYVATQSGSLNFIDLTNLEVTKKIKFTNSSFTRVPYFHEDDRHLTSTNGSLIILNKNGSSYTYRIASGHVFSSPVIFEEKLICTSRDEFIRCFVHE